MVHDIKTKGAGQGVVDDVEGLFHDPFTLLGGAQPLWQWSNDYIQ